MNNYKDLLLSQEWRNKRKEIIERDLNCCTSCKNEHLISKLERGIVHFDERYHWKSSFDNRTVRMKIIDYKNNSLVPRDIERWVVEPKLNQIYIVYFNASWRQTSPRTKVEDFTIVATRHADKYVYLSSPIKDDLISFLTGDDYYPLKAYISQESYTSIYSNDYRSFKWHKVHGLHVHHSYYQIGKNPWEYPSQSLTTFCWHCHEKFHKDYKVPYLNKDGHKIGEVTPCKRCSGAGTFPEYAHVDRGICFRCNGAKYEELITK